MLRNSVLAIISIAFCLTLGETAMRMRLERRGILRALSFEKIYVGQSAPNPGALLGYAQAAAVGSDSALISFFPAEPRERTYGHPRPESERLRKTFRGPLTEDLMKQWNLRFLSEHAADEVAQADQYQDGMMYAFKPYDSTRHPIYRFFPNSQVGQTKVNQFGFSGSDVELAKGARTIRLAFLGASTTEQYAYPFAYPDYIEEWLNLWAHEEGRDLHFEVINAGRVGLRSADFAAILKYELLPFQPDLVVYYEGRNQMEFARPFPQETGDAQAMSLGTEALWRSALFQEIMPAIGMPPLRLLEALKPRPAPNPLATLARDHPDPRSPGLPTNLSEIFANLEVIRTALRRHQTFVLSSYAMLADDRLLDDPKYSTAFAYWQESYPGVRLSDIATLNAYQNALFRNYAKLRGLPFLELADALVAHPDLFEDGIHLNAAGKKLQGWLAFLQILPLIRSQLDAGILPHSEEAIPVRHPYLEDEAVLVDARHASN